MEQKKYNDLEPNSHLEMILTIAKGVLSAVPIGSTIASVFGDWQNVVQYNSIKTVLEEYGRQISKLGKDKLDNEYLNSKEHGYDILQTIAKAKDEINEDRLRLFSDYISSCCYKENLHCENKRIFLDIVNQLEFIDLELLRLSSDSFRNKDFIEEVCWKLKTTSHKINKVDIQIHVEYLASIGLLKKADEKDYEKYLKISLANPKQDPMKKKSYYKSILGRKFLSFLKAHDI